MLSSGVVLSVDYKYKLMVSSMLKMKSLVFNACCMGASSQQLLGIIRSVYSHGTGLSFPKGLKAFL